MADNEKYFTKLVDGQLSVATVSQSGEIIPEESRPGDVYTTALVNTDNGPQLCVKTFDLNGGGGGGGTVDQTYDPTSTNAQSGTAVAEAVQPCLQNKSTNENSVTVSNNQITTAAASSVFITPRKSTNTSANYSVCIGVTSGETDGKSNVVAIGYSVTANGVGSTAIGHLAYASGGSSASEIGATSVGQQANATWGTALGAFTQVSGTAVAVGRGYNSSHRVKASANKSIAIGCINTSDQVCEATAEDTIQLGNGTNSTANTLQVFTFQLLDGTTGLIPAERLGTGYDATKTQVLKNVNGTLTWVDE